MEKLSYSDFIRKFSFDTQFIALQINNKTNLVIGENHVEIPTKSILFTSIDNLNCLRSIDRMHVTFIATIELNKNATYIFDNFINDMFWTDCFNVKNIYDVMSDDIEKYPEGVLKVMFKMDDTTLFRCKNQTPELCKLAVQYDGQVGATLYYIKKQTPEICKLAVCHNGFALQYVKEQTPEICKLAVQQTGYALEYVKEQTPEICKLAVQQNGLSLVSVKNKTPEICKLAIQQNTSALQFTY
jgi:hypothetical protein